MEVEIHNVTFAYGQETILASLNEPEGQAISYRFKKEKEDKKAHRVRKTQFQKEEARLEKK
jgi:hypothetical protein